MRSWRVHSARTPLGGQVMVEPQVSPRHVLMIKSHSLGVGDLLRSSAAWRVMNNAWPGVELHLLFLSKHPGYPTQDLIAAHHLLSSAHFITLREGSPQAPSAKRVPMSRIFQQALEVCEQQGIDWIIDFEMNGLRTAWLTWQLQRAMGQGQKRAGQRSLPAASCLHAVQTLGVNQFWPRGCFYRQSSVSLTRFMRQEGLSAPMDYTLRDFVVLAALGLRRQETPIELQAGAASLARAQALLSDAFPQVGSGPKRPLWGLNIGCGTPDALGKRPPMADLVQSLVALAQHHDFDLVLTGAPFEREVNEDFIEKFSQAFSQALSQAFDPVLDEQPVAALSAPRLCNAAGTGTLEDLSGLIVSCECFVSTDSGPYHMAVALKVPTLVWFVIDQPASYHDTPWCARVVNPSAQGVLEAVSELRRRALENRSFAQWV